MIRNLCLFLLAGAAMAATITDFTPDTGITGTSVDITGTALGVADPTEIVVRIGEIEATVSTRCDTTLTVIVPTGAKPSRISIQTNDGHIEAGRIFQVLPPSRPPPHRQQLFGGS